MSRTGEKEGGPMADGVTCALPESLGRADSTC